jgi:hypothetical protein
MLPRALLFALIGVICLPAIGQACDPVVARKPLAYYIEQLQSSDAKLWREVRALAQSSVANGRSETTASCAPETSPTRLGEFPTRATSNARIQAEWKRVLRTVDEQPPKRVKLDGMVLNQFATVLEDHLEIRLPEWWKTIFSGATAQGRRTVRFAVPDRETWPYGRNAAAEYFAASDTSLRDVDGGLIAIARGESCLITDDLLKQARSDGHVDAIQTLVDGEHAYVALHSMRSGPYTLARVHRRTGAVLWSSTVRPFGTKHILYTGRGYHFVGLVIKNGSLSVLGAADDCAYVATFARDTGEPQFWFSTADGS